MNSKMIMHVREQLLKIFSIGLDAVNGRRCVYQDLTQNPLPGRRVWVAAIGKAAHSMMLGACDYFNSVYGDTAELVSGLVITKPGHGVTFDTENIVLIESDHPIPTDRSLEAGQRLLEFVTQVPDSDCLLFLISGGTSALVEVLPVGTTLEQLNKLNQWLLSNPWSIDQINQVRQSVSCIKKGKLLDYINTPHVLQLTISDVVSNDLSVIGSGLLVSETTKPANVPIPLPGWVKQMQGICAENTRTTPGNVHVEHRIIADNARAREAIETDAATLGLITRLNTTFEGDVDAAGRMIANTLINGEPGIYIWGGETVIDLPDNPGQGGRSQSLALLLAQAIDQHNDIVLLAAGSDGSDGPTDVAGAMIDGMTIERGKLSDLNSQFALSRANAGAYLEETGDLIDTGPTGTNVMDLVIGIKLDAR